MKFLKKVEAMIGKRYTSPFDKATEKKPITWLIQDDNTHGDETLITIGISPDHENKKDWDTEFKGSFADLVKHIKKTYPRVKTVNAFDPENVYLWVDALKKAGYKSKRVKM